MKKIIKVFSFAAGVILIVWIILTLWVESTGEKKSWEIGNLDSEEKILIVYDPDPLYNLDEQVCRSFGEAFAAKGMRVVIASVAVAREMNQPSFDLYVFCANTYNWRPDWSICNFIKEKMVLAGKPVVAITLGSGSTWSAQQAFESIIKDKKGNLIDSRSFWLLKPNDELRMNESNVEVALSLVYEWASDIEKKYQSYKSRNRLSN